MHPRVQKVEKPRFFPFDSEFKFQAPLMQYHCCIGRIIRLGLGWVWVGLVGFKICRRIGVGLGGFDQVGFNHV